MLRVKNMKQKRFQRRASCLNQNMIWKTRNESKNLAIFRRNKRAKKHKSIQQKYMQI